jgi:hypothetical protein
MTVLDSLPLLNLHTPFQDERLERVARTTGRKIR